MLAKYQHDVDMQNQKVDSRAAQLKGITGSITGALASHGIQKGFQALSALGKTAGFNPLKWNKEDATNRTRNYLDSKGINADLSNFAEKDAGLMEATRGGYNAFARMGKTGEGDYNTNFEYSREAFSRRMANRNNQFGVENFKDNTTKIDFTKARELEDFHKNFETNIGKNKSKSFEDFLTTNASQQGSKNQNPNHYIDLGNNSMLNPYGKGMSGGGRVEGPGGIDQVGPVMLDRGEYVVRASSVDNIEKKYPGFFDRLNSMKMNEGGPVGKTPAKQDSQINTTENSSSNVTVNINVSSAGQASVEGGGASDQACAAKIKDAVVGVISQEKRVGGRIRWRVCGS